VKTKTTVLDGLVVPETYRCAFCNRAPCEGEKFGHGEYDWDAVGMVCPDCFPREGP
jgi:hypothetical protein